MSSPPLEGIKVLDMARYIAGPFCSMMLGDMGADVVKVERPGGEDTRHLQPSRDGHSVYTMLYNRNKRAITINPRSDRGRELLVELAGWADVVVENYRPGTMERMGLGYDRLHEINPRIILTSISGFGQTGPLRDRALFDAIGQAMAGVMSLTGSPDGPPTMTGTYTADHTTGLYAALGTVLALRDRDRTGEGQHVDVALLDAMYSAIGVAASAYLNTGEVMGRTGNRDSLAAPGNTFQTADGWIYLDASGDALFKRLMQGIGHPALIEDPRFADGVTRFGNAAQLEQIIQEWARDLTSDEVGEALLEAGIPYGSVADMAEAAASPQLQSRDMIVSIDHPEMGEVRIPGLPVKLSRSPGSIRRPPPVVGEHTAEVLGEICGLTAEQIDELRSDGAI
jgi:crotonobetainyl-CoA:carnitine CoA-transferase CaiB-like acyl-CoA transferase